MVLTEQSSSRRKSSSMMPSRTTLMGTRQIIAAAVGLMYQIDLVTLEDHKGGQQPPAGIPVVDMATKLSLIQMQAAGYQIDLMTLQE